MNPSLSPHYSAPRADRPLATAMPADQEPKSLPPSHVSSLLRDPAALAILLFFFLLIASSSLFKRLDHDEHQFVAPGALLARRGLVPYRDYPFFHTPYLIYLNAAVFHLTKRLLLGARWVSILSAFGTLTLFYHAAASLFHSFGRRTRLIAAAAATFLLVANPIYVYTTGRAWNHDAPMFLALASFFAAMRGIRRQRARWLFLAGVLIGLASGARLTFIVASAIMLAVPFLAPSLSWPRRLRFAAALAFGLGLALLPLALLALKFRDQFVFGNFTYPMLNTAFRSASGYAKAMTPLQKLRYLLIDTLLPPPTVAAAILLIILVIIARRRWRQAGNPFRLETQVLTLLSLAMLAAGAAPTPLFQPYFYTPVVLLALLGVYCAAAAWSDAANRTLVTRLLAIVLLVCIGPAAYAYRAVLWSWNPHWWVPVGVHQEGVDLARACDAAIAPRRSHSAPRPRVLSIIPLVPLEGGLDVFEQLATGPFTVRIAAAVAEQDEALPKIMDPNDVARAFWSTPNAVVLVGSRDHWEEDQLLQAIGPSRLRSLPAPPNYQLWTRPPQTPTTTHP